MFDETNNYNKEIINKIKDGDKSYFIKEDNSINSTYDKTLNDLFIEKSKKSRSDTIKMHKNKMPIITAIFKEELEKMVDEKFEEEYIKLNNDYEEKINELLNEQEKIYNKNEIIKAKYYALEKYLKNYCRKLNIDYESLLLN